MPTLTVTQDYTTGAALTKTHLDNAFDSIETFVNTTKIDNSNIQTGGIATANYAALSVDAAALAASAVTTAKIADNAVTQAKRVALPYTLSSSSGSYTTTSTSYGDVTNLSVSLTTTGRPVEIFLVPDGTANQAFIGVKDTVGTGNHVAFKMLRDSTSLGEIRVFSRADLSGGETTVEVPPGAVRFVEVPAAGTYTYKIQAKIVNATSTGMVDYCKLIAIEL